MSSSEVDDQNNVEDKTALIYMHELRATRCFGWILLILGSIQIWFGVSVYISFDESNWPRGRAGGFYGGIVAIFSALWGLCAKESDDMERTARWALYSTIITFVALVLECCAATKMETVQRCWEANDFTSYDHQNSCSFDTSYQYLADRECMCDFSNADECSMIKLSIISGNICEDIPTKLAPYLRGSAVLLTFCTIFLFLFTCSSGLSVRDVPVDDNVSLANGVYVSRSKDGRRPLTQRAEAATSPRPIAVTPLPSTVQDATRDICSCEPDVVRLPAPVEAFQSRSANGARVHPAELDCSALSATPTKHSRQYSSSRVAPAPHHSAVLVHSALYPVTTTTTTTNNHNAIVTTATVSSGYNSNVTEYSTVTHVTTDNVVLPSAPLEIAEKV